VINARTDAPAPADAEAVAVDAVIARCLRYRQARADGVFPIFVDHSLLSEIIAAVDAPVPTLYRPSWPSLAELARLGVARVSYGPGLYRACQALAAKMLAAVRAGADPYQELSVGPVAHGEAEEPPD
jgi:2-methylisocitrate lyase-like PEP mutase family enzyme